MTPVTKRAFDFIKEYISSNGYSPTYLEIAGELDIVKSGAHRAVKSLEREGLVIAPTYITRGIQIMDDDKKKIIQLSNANAILMDEIKRLVESKDSNHE